MLQGPSDAHVDPAPATRPDWALTLALLWVVAGSLYLLDAAEAIGSGTPANGSALPAAGSLALALALLALPSGRVYALAGAWAGINLARSMVVVVDGGPALLPSLLVALSVVALACAVVPAIRVRSQEPATIQAR